LLPFAPLDRRRAFISSFLAQDSAVSPYYTTKKYNILFSRNHMQACYVTR